MKTISKTEAAELINKSKGQIFTAHFFKKNGEARAMNCRLGVKKGVTGKGMSYNPTNRGLKPVFDMQAKDYRMVNLETLYALRIDKTDYLVE